MEPSTVMPPSEPIVTLPAPDIFPVLDSFFKGLIAAYPSVATFAKHAVGILIGLSFPLSLMFLIGIIFCVEQLKRIREREKQIYELKVEPAYEAVTAGDPTLAHRWESVSRHIEAPDQNDWKQAIIEADIILNDILTKMGYRGESVGEKLKRAEPADFNTLNEAWEAHKVRNSIAHEPAFTMNHHEAKRVISMYRKVFEEFYYI